MQKIFSVILLFVFSSVVAQQKDDREIKITVVSEEQAVLPNSTVALLRPTDSALLRTVITDEAGIALFRNLASGNYICRISRVSYKSFHTALLDLRTKSSISSNVVLYPASNVLQDVTVTSKRPLVQLMPDKTIINVEAGITNAGATVLEVLEKSPGVTIDRDGNISLKGRTGVQVMIDGRLTNVSGTELNNLLNGMNASQVDQIELIDNPSAKYDAAGNAGLINIKLKKNKQKGFNGTLTVAFGQGIYPKNNNNLQLNYRTGSFNFFANYSINANQGMLEMYARRTYYKDEAKTIPEAILEQPFFNKGTGFTNTLRTGMDYYLSKKTTLGLTMTGTALKRKNVGTNTARWINEDGTVDSLIYTNSNNNSKWRNAGVNLNARHVFNANKELSADIDYLRYKIRTDQYFENTRTGPSGYVEVNRGDLPSDLEIISAKVDYLQRFHGLQWESGWKSSHVNTDNFAQYYNMLAGNWQPDLGRTNHFLYTENIHALYANFSSTRGKWDLQAGLRYEYTGYRANQLGNGVVKDSSFTRNYHNLFPSVFVTYNTDSSNSFSFRAGRRIDRPPFQKLNPFISIINKYTYQSGNPLILPQYTWNLEVSHMFKHIITTSLSYNYTTDYFSQIFYPGSDSGTIVYSDGNVGEMQNLGATISAQLSLAKWWSLTAQGTFTHKRFEGELWRNYKATISQFILNLNNQFRFKKGWAAELSGFYISKNQNDIQEVLDPTGQVSAGLSKQLMKNKATLRLTVRDIFYTQDMEGWTHFEHVIEYFRLQRDSRVATISFTWRFGQAIKQSVKKSSGADDEINRVGSAN